MPRWAFLHRHSLRVRDSGLTGWTSWSLAPAFSLPPLLVPLFWRQAITCRLQLRRHSRLSSPCKHPMLIIINKQQMPSPQEPYAYTVHDSHSTGPVYMATKSVNLPFVDSRGSPALRTSFPIGQAGSLRTRVGCYRKSQREPGSHQPSGLIAAATALL